MNAAPQPGTTAATAAPPAPSRRDAALLGACLALGLLWSYWPTLGTAAARWTHDPQYSHGFLVLPFALFVAWKRRKSFPAELRPCWWGVAGLAAAAGLRLVGGYFFFDWFEGLSLLLSLPAAGVLVGGW